MKASSHGMSSTQHLICPSCELGGLQPRDPAPVCDSCGRAVDRAILEALWQIVVLPEAIGAHACECGHPEMRRLPDKVFWCPACGSEVLPLETG